LGSLAKPSFGVRRQAIEKLTACGECPGVTSTLASANAVMPRLIA
jgi:hypothetical protein